MGGGGGGDGGAQARQEESDTKKRAARERLNALFGVGSASPAPSAPASGRSWMDDEGMVYAGAPDPIGAPAMSEADRNKAARDALYAKVREDSFTAGRRGLDEGKTQAARENRFALFAQGLAGGSEDVDQNALLDRTYREGLLKLGGKADATVADMRGNDESTRLQLLQSIDAGMDEGSAISSALGQMKVNSDRAAATAQGTDLGDLFAGSGLLYTKSNAARGTQAARDQYGSLYPQLRRPGGASANGGAGGYISRQGVDG